MPRIQAALLPPCLDAADLARARPACAGRARAGSPATGRRPARRTATGARNTAEPPLKPARRRGRRPGAARVLRGLGRPGHRAPHPASRCGRRRAAKIAWTWRQARANSPRRLPLARSAHGNQRPFISCAKRSRTGPPVGGDLAGPAPDVGVVVARDDARQAVARLVRPRGRGVPRLPGDLGRRAAGGDRRRPGGRRSRATCAQSANHMTRSVRRRARCSKASTWRRSPGRQRTAALRARASVVTPSAIRGRRPVAGRSAAGSARCAGGAGPGAPLPGRGQVACRATGRPRRPAGPRRAARRGADARSSDRLRQRRPGRRARPPPRRRWSSAATAADPARRRSARRSRPVRRRRSRSSSASAVTSRPRTIDALKSTSTR